MSPKPDIRDRMNKPEKVPENDVAGPEPRRKTTQVMVGNVAIGGGAPIVVQSMTNTDTADVEGTIAQVAALSRAGSEMVRITVDREEAASAVPHIRDGLRKRGITTPLIGDFHYIGHKLLADYPACAEALDKYRINPGNVGFKNKRDSQFTDIVEMALKYGKTVRIGANWGSLDQELLTKLMDENALLAEPKDVRAVTREAMVQSALLSAARAEEIGLPKNKMILSAKVSAVQDLIAVYQTLASRSDYAIHLGLTGAGRRSHAGSAGRAGTAADHGFSHLRAAGRGMPRLRPHHLDHLPGTGALDPGFHPRRNAWLEDALSRRRIAQRRDHGLHRQWPRRVQACRYRHLLARHRRDAGGAGVRRRQEIPHFARPQHRHRIQGDGDRLYRPALRRGGERAREHGDRGGVVDLISGSARG